MDTSQVALKEWAVVCEALGAEAQHVLFRKGGIHEGPDGFTPEHKEFWLFPTGFHQSLEAIRPEFREAAAKWSLAPPAGNVIELRHFCQVGVVRWIERESDLVNFREQHVLTDETVRERFHYRKPGIFLLEVRTTSLDEPRVIPHDPRYDGCKSWVVLEGTDLVTPS